MKPYMRNPVHLLAVVRRYSLIQVTRWVRCWEKRPLPRRKRDVILLFGCLLLVLLANLSQHLTATAGANKDSSPVNVSDSTVHHQLYMNELHNRKLTPSR